MLTTYTEKQWVARNIEETLTVRIKVDIVRVPRQSDERMLNK